MRGVPVRSTSLGSLLLTTILACGAAPPAPAPLPPLSPAVAVIPMAAPAAPSPPPPATVPDTPAGRQLTWVLASMSRAPSEAEVTPHFTPAFLAQVPAKTVVELFRQVATAAPFTLERVNGGRRSQPGELLAIVRSTPGPRLRVKLIVEPAESGRIDTLFLRPFVEGPPATSWDDAKAKLRAVAPSVNFLAAEIDTGTCVPIASIDPEKPLAIGSAFKLYVLDALASQIISGKHTWDEKIPIDDAHKSLPSGPMRDEPAGKTFSVREYAERMISVSDNTAADHLLAFVGRGAVEAAVKASGHANPSALAPFLSTREMFALKLLGSPAERSAYVAADVEHKRALLGDYGHRDLGQIMAQASSFTKPVMIDSIEWLASPNDLCKVMVDLHARAESAAAAPVSSILSINPGLPDSRRHFRYIGFKGGSEPGVLNLTWLLQRARDGKWLFLSVGFNNTSEEFDEGAAIDAAAKARELLGR